MDVYNSYLFPPREAVIVYMPCRYTPKRCLCVVSTAANSAVMKHPDNAWWEQGGSLGAGRVAAAHLHLTCASTLGT